MKRLMVGLLSAGLLVAMLPGVTAAKSWECVGWNGVFPYAWNVTVPSGTYCALWTPASPVTGNIEVGGAGAMVRIVGAEMDGNISVVEPGGQVNLSGTYLDGNIECEYPGTLWLYGTFSTTVIDGHVEGCSIIDHRTD